VSSDAGGGFADSTAQLASAAASAEARGKAIGVAVTIECGAHHDAKVKDMQHGQVARDDIVFGKPRPHIGQMAGDGLASVARDDDGFQCAAPVARLGVIMAHRAYSELTRLANSGVSLRFSDAAPFLRDDRNPGTMVSTR
jgi:hypothetical protein